MQRRIDVPWMHVWKRVSGTTRARSATVTVAVSVGGASVMRSVRKTRSSDIPATSANATTTIATITTEKSAEVRKGAITSKIKHAIELKTSPARLAQLLQPSLAFCFSL